MGEVVKGNFETEGLAIADKRAIALHEWLAGQPEEISTEAVKAEMARLRRIMPSPEDALLVSNGDGDRG